MQKRLSEMSDAEIQAWLAEIDAENEKWIQENPEEYQEELEAIEQNRGMPHILPELDSSPELVAAEMEELLRISRGKATPVKVKRRKK